RRPGPARGRGAGGRGGPPPPPGRVPAFGLRGPGPRRRNFAGPAGSSGPPGPGRRASPGPGGRPPPPGGPPALSGLWCSSLLQLPDKIPQAPPRLPAGPQLLLQRLPCPAARPDLLQVGGADVCLAQPAALPPKGVVVRAVQLPAGTAAVQPAATDPLRPDHAGEHLG